MEDKVVQLKDEVLSLLVQIADHEGDNIRKAANIICDAMVQERRVHILGTGAHSQIAVEEVLWRAGGLAAWNPIIDPGTSLVHGAKRSVSFERAEGYGISVLNANAVGSTPEEVMVIVNAYGIDPMSIDVALECRKRKVTTIGVTSPAYGRMISADSPIRHSSRKNLFEEVDVFINSHVPFGDAVVSIDGFMQKVGSASSFCSCFVMNAMVAEIVQELARRNVEPPVFMSANVPGGDKANARWENKYGCFARYLL